MKCLLQLHLYSDHGSDGPHSEWYLWPISVSLIQTIDDKFRYTMHQEVCVCTRVQNVLPLFYNHTRSSSEQFGLSCQRSKMDINQPLVLLHKVLLGLPTVQIRLLCQRDFARQRAQINLEHMSVQSQTCF